MMMAERWPTKLLYKYFKCLSFSLFFFFIPLERSRRVSAFLGKGPDSSRRLNKQFIGEKFQQLEKGSDKCQTFKMYYSPINFSWFCTQFAV